jgi:phytoene dehydrogenase-like protein
VAAADVVIIGAGPNGLSAAIALGRAGIETAVLEAAQQPGGGLRTEEITLRGFHHDVCSAVHPLALASPFLRSLDLARHGLTWIQPDCPLVHVGRDGQAFALERSLQDTAMRLGNDGAEWLRIAEPFIARFDELMDTALGPLRRPASPSLVAEFGLLALRSARGLADAHFRGTAMRALFAGMAAHSMQPLDSLATSAIALVLALAAHVVGWPIPRGGSRSVCNALIAELRERGGSVMLGRSIRTLADLPPARAYVFDVTPRQLLAITEGALPSAYRRRLLRFRYGPGVCKVDWALRAPIPWLDRGCARAATVHLGGTLEDIATAEAAVAAGKRPKRPFVILVQPTLFDTSRAPDGMHTAWAYCHVPLGSNESRAAAIERQIEKAAPGFHETVLARSVRTAADLERLNPNLIGGDINGGSARLSQLFFRPTMSRDPYATPHPKIFLCSASTPPGGGVHGMCGYWAAQSVLRSVFGKRALS